jgi:RNA polymerase sigma-70 factor (ECF subfamily)
VNNKNEESTRALVARIGAGDPRAESELIERFSRGVMAMLRQRTADWDLAADIHQDTFVVVLQRLRNGELQHPERLSAFIRQTAINLHLAGLRKDKRRNTEPDSEKIALAADLAAGPLARLEASQRRGLLKTLIEGLRVDRDRQLLDRYYLNEHSKQEICADLELESAHFDRVLHRARKRLGELVSQWNKVDFP